MHRRFLLTAAVLAAALSLRADVAVAPRETGPSAQFAFSPVVVADGDELVVFWWTSEETRFVRIRGDVIGEGQLDGVGRIIAATAAADGTVRALCWDGTTARVAAIDRVGVVRMTDLSMRSISTAAWNGTSLLLVDGDGNALITDGSGSVLQSGMRLPQADGDWRAAKREDGFIVVWSSRDQMYAATVSPSGQVSPALPFGEKQAFPVAIACDSSTTCLVVYDLLAQLRGVFIRGVMGPSFALSSDLNAFEPAPLVWDGSRFLLASSSSTTIGGRTDVHVTEIGLDGAVATIATISHPDRSSGAATIATSPADTIVVWSDSTVCSPRSAQIMARSLSTKRDLRLTHGLSSQSQPAIAAGTTTSLVAWEEQSDRVRIRARVFPANDDAFEVSSGPSSALPAVASDGNAYLVAWQQADPDEGCRITIRATLAESGAVVTLGHDAYWAMRPQVGWNGSEYVVLWEQNDPRALVAMRVDRTGTPLDSAPQPLTPPETMPDSFTSIRHDPASLLWTGNGYLLVWSRNKTVYIPWHSDPPPVFDARTSLIGRDLVPVGLPQVVAPNAHGAVATIKSGTVLALWSFGGTLHAVRLTTGGTLVSDRDLGIANEYPSVVVPSPSGYAAIAGQEILYLDEAGALIAHQPIPGLSSTLAAARSGVMLAYELDGSIDLSTTPSRQRTLR